MIDEAIDVLISLCVLLCFVAATGVLALCCTVLFQAIRWVLAL